MTRKPATLHQIRRQVAAKSRSISSVTSGSAFRRIEKRNERFEHGHSFRTKEEGAEFPRFVEPKKVKRVAAKRKTATVKPKAKPEDQSTEAVEPVDTYWRTAGGDSHLLGGDTAAREPTRILGIARVPVWTLEKFKASLKTVLEHHGEVQDLVVQEVKDGQEEMADVYAVFRSELVAEFVREEAEGVVVEGRKVRVGFA